MKLGLWRGRHQTGQEIARLEDECTGAVLPHVFQRELEAAVRLGRQGERLVSMVQVPKASGPKNLPYDLTTAKTRIAQRLRRGSACASST